MFDNPPAAGRFAADAVPVAMMPAFLAWTRLAAPGSASLRVWLIGGVALAGALAQVLVSALFAGKVPPACVEQGKRTIAGSYAFGHWTALAAFLSLSLATVAGRLAPGAAFSWLAPILAAAPSFSMLVAGLRGRAG